MPQAAHQGPLYPEHLNSSTCWPVLRQERKPVWSRMLGGHPTPPTVGSFLPRGCSFPGQGQQFTGVGVGAQGWGPAELELLEAEGEAAV